MGRQSINEAIYLICSVLRSQGEPYALFPNVPWASAGPERATRGGRGRRPSPARSRPSAARSLPCCLVGASLRSWACRWRGKRAGAAFAPPPRCPSTGLCVAAPVLRRESKVRKSWSGEAGGHPPPRPGHPSVSFPRVGGAEGWRRHAPPCGGAGRTVSPALPRLPEPLNAQNNVFPRGRGRRPPQRRALSVEAQLLACSSAGRRLKMRQQS